MGVIALTAIVSVIPCRGDETPRVPERGATFSLLETEQFASLEKLTTGLRVARIGFYNGWPLIDRFYSNLSFATPDDKVWARYIDLLLKWEDAFPESPTPRIALANLYKDYAWQARGDGYSDTVTREGRRLFDERLKKSVAILGEAKALKVQDAELYCTFIIVAKGLGLPRAQMEDAFKRGQAIDPDFTPLYSAKADYLLPRWRGADGDWEAFAKEEADKRGGDNGDILYMFIVRSEAYTWGEGLFKDTGISYERMRLGFRLARARYPNNGYDLNSYCYFASIAGDKETAKQLFAAIGEGYNQDVWGSVDTFTKWRNWANRPDIMEILRPSGAVLVGLKVAVGVLVAMVVGLIVYFVKPKDTPPSTPTLQ
jgi:hypothetical protein